MIILTGAAVAFAIAFGVGGRTFAANRLAKLERKLDTAAETDDAPEYPPNRPGTN